MQGKCIFYLCHAFLNVVVRLPGGWERRMDTHASLGVAQETATGGAAARPQSSMMAGKPHVLASTKRWAAAGGRLLSRRTGMRTVSREDAAPVLRGVPPLEKGALAERAHDFEEARPSGLLSVEEDLRERRRSLQRAFFVGRKSTGREVARRVPPARRTCRAGPSSSSWGATACVSWWMGALCS